MSAEAFRRVKRFLDPYRGQRVLSQALGVLAGLLYVGWMVILVLFTEILLDRGELAVTGADAAFAATLLGEPAPAGEWVLTDKGLLAVAVGTRDNWYGGALEFLYRALPWTHSTIPYLASLVVAALLIGLARVLLLFGQHVTGASATTRAMTRLRSEIFRHWSELGSQAFEPGTASRITPLLRRHVPRVESGLAQALLTRAPERAKSVGLLLFAILLNPLLGLCFVIMAILLWIVGSWAVYRVLRRRKELTADSEAHLNRVLGLADKLRLIRGYAAADYFQSRYRQHLERQEENSRRRLGYEARVVVVWQILGLLLALVVVILGAVNVMTDRFALSMAVGVYTSLASVMLPLYLLLRCRQEIRVAGKSAAEIFDFLDQHPSTRQREGGRFLQPLADSMELERVTYKNAFGAKLLDDVSIRIHAGQRVALVGRDAATLRAFVYLFTRFIDPTKGRVRIDGVDIREFTFESLRSQTCMVLQGDLLFPDTVANNIGCGDPGYSMQRIIAAAKLAHAHHFVQRLPRGYECLVGEEGFPLKIGESFRVALARAILRDPPVVIVEEPAQALDEDTTAMLADTMNRFFRERTVLLLPRRLSTVRDCDQVFAFDQGKLAACGNHRELMETSDLYRHLQYTEFLPDIPR